MADGQFCFSCTHCGTVLTYTARQPLVESPHQGLTGARLLAALVFLAGIVLLSLVSALLGRETTLVILAAAAVALIAYHLFSPRPAYKIAARDGHDDAAKP
jgi:hypothetical protein